MSLDYQSPESKLEQGGALAPPNVLSTYKISILSSYNQELLTTKYLETLGVQGNNLLLLDAIASLDLGYESEWVSK